MVDISKEQLGKLLDSDGKIMISDDMSDDLKAAINYLNSNNVGLFSPHGAYADVEEEEPDLFAEDGSDENEEIEDTEEIEEDDLEETSDGDSDIEDLNNLF